MAIAKEQLRQIISENDVKSVGDIYTLFKESFKDMLQELLEQFVDDWLAAVQGNMDRVHILAFIQKFNREDSVAEQLVGEVRCELFDIIRCQHK